MSIWKYDRDIQVSRKPNRVVKYWIFTTTALYCLDLRDVEEAKGHSQIQSWFSDVGQGQDHCTTVV